MMRKLQNFPKPPLSLLGTSSPATGIMYSNNCLANNSVSAIISSGKEKISNVRLFTRTTTAIHKQSILNLRFDFVSVHAQYNNNWKITCVWHVLKKLTFCFHNLWNCLCNVLYGMTYDVIWNAILDILAYVSGIKLIKWK